MAIIPALTALATSGYQMFQADRQKKAANRLKPSNYVPPAVEEAIAGARMDANASSPGYTRGLERLRQSTANTINSAKRVGGSNTQLQQTVADADAREKEAVKDLEVSDAAYRANSRRNLQGLLMTKGGYQQQSQDAYNAAKSALIGASEQNKYNAITQLGEGIVNSLPTGVISPTGKSGGVGTAAPPKTGSTARVPFISKNGQTLPDLNGGPLTAEQLKQLMGIRPRRQFYSGY